MKTLQHSAAGQVDNASARGGRSGAQSADKPPDKSDEKDADKSGKKEDNKSETPPEAKEESKPEDRCDPKKLLFSFDEGSGCAKSWASSFASPRPARCLRT